MKRTYGNIIAVTLLGLMCLSTTPLTAQKKAKATPKAQAKTTLTVAAAVVDTDGNAIRNASVTCGEGALVIFTDKEGRFSLVAKTTDILTVEAMGYETQTIHLAAGVPTSITLQKSEIYGDAANMLDRGDGGYTARNVMTGAISSVDLDKLEKYPDLIMSNGLQGKAAGLIVRANAGDLGNNSTSIYVRGQHTQGTNTAIVVIDGIERAMEDIIPEEIERIEVLKDINSKILYGPAAANGVINITTKRGQANTRQIKTSMEYGIMPSTKTTSWLDSYNYANLYNEACQNDGLPARYLPYQIEGYMNSTGENDLLYPNNDFLGKFMGNSQSYRKIAFQTGGGNEELRYSMVLGYTGGDGLEAEGTRSGLNRVNLRGNADIKINDVISVVANVAARVELTTAGQLSGGSLYSSSTSLRPNVYPLVISTEEMGKFFTEQDANGNIVPISPRTDGVPFFGTNRINGDNIYSKVLYGGSVQERYISSQNDLGFNFNLGKYLKGLKAGAYVTLDSYNYVRQALSKVYSTYYIDQYMTDVTDGEGNTTYSPTYNIVKYRNDNLSTSHAITNETTSRTTGIRANIGWDTHTDVDQFSINLAYNQYHQEKKGSTQDARRAQLSLRTDYVYDNRYSAELILSGVGCNKFLGNNKFLFTPAVGLGWIISNEEFMEDVKSVDYLKLKASAGRMGYSINSGYMLYLTEYYEDGTFNLGENNNSSAYITSLSRLGNPNLKWETSTEGNIGFEGVFLNKRLAVDVDAYYEYRDNIIISSGNLYLSALGGYVPSYNYNAVSNRGVDVAVNWNDKFSNDFYYSIGVNFNFNRNVLEKSPELKNVESYRSEIGRSTSNINGLQVAGMFGRDIDIASWPEQQFGYYTSGDFAYRDLNGDNVIDGNDVTSLGKSFPSTVWGIDGNINYKGLGLYVQFTAETGVSKMLNNSYYQNTGDGNWSVLALERYHEVNNPAGTYPRLTTTPGDNSYRNNSFWLSDASFLRLKNIELSYTRNIINSASIIKQWKVFARGTNLFVLSKIKDLDPETLNAGVSTYPAYRGLTAGISLTF